MLTSTHTNQSFTVVVPAAGIGKRMSKLLPKQYLTINHKTIIEHTVERLLSHQQISHVIIALAENDPYFVKTTLAKNPNVSTVIGGKERCDSVLAGVNSLQQSVQKWVLVHDAARPCVTHKDISELIDRCLNTNEGAILASPVRDTMKRSNDNGQITLTENRNNLWHALTPQMFQTQQLQQALVGALKNKILITDEASAIEYSQQTCNIVSAREDNIKITRPSDLKLATFILTSQEEELCE